MKRRVFVLTLLVSGLLWAAPAQAAVNVFACEPEWGALAEEIGGEHVAVYVATTPRQNVHYLRARPSFLAKMRRAGLVFCNGASLEAGWLPLLLQKAGSPAVQPDQPGYLMAADQVDKLDVPVTVDRSMGDVHPEGNPHVVTDPRNILAVAEVLAGRLAVIDPGHAAEYRNNLAGFKDRWIKLIGQWEAQGQALRGRKVVVYHTSWAYLLDWLGMEAVASLEPKPGLPPTTSHLEAVLLAVKKQEVAAILVAPFEDQKAASWLSERTGIPVVALPYTVGGSDSAGDLAAVFDETLALLRKAVQ